MGDSISYYVVISVGKGEAEVSFAHQLSNVVMVCVYQPEQRPEQQNLQQRQVIWIGVQNVFKKLMFYLPKCLEVWTLWPLDLSCLSLNMVYQARP